MKCQGKFKMKELKLKDGGNFINSKGDTVSYASSYSLKVDEATEQGIYERVFKIATDSPLVPQLSQIKPYEDITLNFEVQIYSSGVKLIPISLVK